MIRALGVAFILLWNLGIARAASESPQHFAYGQPVVIMETAGAYRVTLPLAIYQNTWNANLADLRVFNDAGEVVPYSLSRPAEQARSKESAVSLPLFPLHGSPVLINGVQVTINSSGSAVSLQTQNGSGRQSNGTRQYLLEAHDSDTAYSALQLTWPDTAADFTGRLSIEVSDDLAAWRAVIAAAPIANLHANGQSLIENRISLPPTKAKFWRLTWLGAAPSVELSAPLAEPACSPIEQRYDTFDVAGLREKDSQDYMFDLSAHIPVTRLNVLLSDVNTLADVELSSRSDINKPWRPITRTLVYRLQTTESEQHNAPIGVDRDTDRFWRAHIVGTGISPQVPLTLHVEWIPNELTFLAKGHEPFLLAFGSATAGRAEADFSHLPTNLQIAAATLGPQKSLGGIARLTAPSTPFPRSRAMLWAILLLSVAILGWMAFRVAKEQRPT
jgi:hypothetical protein